jgi:hypothetical protein
MSFSSTNKYNYIDIVNHMIPDFYRETDYSLFGSEEDISLTFLGKILKAAIQNNLFLDVSNAAMDGPLDVSTVATYFVPDGQTSIGPNEFEKKFMVPYGLKFDSFSTTKDIYRWFSGIFLPDIEVNNPSGLFGVLSGQLSGFTELSTVHAYCKDNLGLFYFMNNPSLSGATTSGDSSSIMVTHFLQPLLRGDLATEKDAINSLFSFFWNNREFSTYYAGFLPPQYVSGVADISANTYLSGTQLLSSVYLQLESWTDPRLKEHGFLKDSLAVLLGDGTASGMGPYPTRMRDAGPFQRFLKAISLGVADINLILEEIGDLLSIDECPEKFLELLANNIGWRFLTGEYGKWRSQLHNAVMMYKTKGSIVGLEAACKLIFPDGTFASSDIGEAWECYLPKLLNYLIKTESFIAVEGLEFAKPGVQFNDSQPHDVRFNQAPPSYENAKNRNYRFLTDAILEDMNNKYCNIIIHGQSFKKLPMWTCLPDTPLKGFYHRNYPTDPPQANGFYVAIPPWEKYGFYTECEISKEEINYLCKTLSGSRNEFGFEVNVVYVQAFKTLCETAINTLYALSGAPAFGNNNKFRLFTSGHELPPNYQKFVEYGHVSAVGEFDEWNTKSSHIFASFAASTLDWYTVGRYDTYKNKDAVGVFAEVLKEFIPFHAVLRLVLYDDLTDTHCVRPTLCITSDKCIDEFNIGYLNSSGTNFWAGASGTGDLSTTYINGDGRVLPTYLEGTAAPSSLFWHVSATDLDRNASRRRNYRYALGCYPYTRIGKGQPIALDHYAIATVAADVDADPYVNTWEYILRGFDYELQSYLAPSSSVWDSSAFFDAGIDCAVTGTTGGYDLSNTYPVRAVPDAGVECSSIPIYRNNMTDILWVMTSRSIRTSLDYVDLKFSDLDYRSFEFGTSVHRNYTIYKSEFSSVLTNTLSSTVPFYGGHNFISYAYGPTIWNSDFRYKGLIDTNIAGDPIPTPSFPWSHGYEPQWSSVVGGTHADGKKYANYQGSAVELVRTYLGNAPAASALDSNQGVIRTRDLHKNPLIFTREILSGLEIRQTNAQSESFVVISNANRVDTNNSVTGYTATLFNTDGRPLQIVVPFDPATIGSTSYNKLRPQSQFGLDIVAKTKSNREEQRVVVELVTSGIADDAGDETEWAYNWVESTWNPVPKLGFQRRGEEYKNYVCISPVLQCPESHRIDFHTKDSATVKSIPCTSVIKTGDVHTSATGYLLKVYNITVGKEVNSVIIDAAEIYEISIVDKVLNDNTNHFNSRETYIIYKFWDDLTTGAYSRDAAYSVDSFETSGGSRAEYLELLGGEDYTSSSTAGVDDYILYEVQD